MARDFNGPLTAADLVYLKQRYSTSYVERMVSLHGVKGKADSAESQAKAEAKAREEQAKAEEEAREAAEQAQREAEAAAGEDLIGDTTSFDVLGATEPEVKAWVDSASDEDKAAALASEQGRTDRDPRKGVVSLLS